MRRLVDEEVEEKKNLKIQYLRIDWQLNDHSGTELRVASKYNGE